MHRLSPQFITDLRRTWKSAACDVPGVLDAARSLVQKHPSISEMEQALLQENRLAGPAL